MKRLESKVLSLSSIGTIVLFSTGTMVLKLGIISDRCRFAPKCVSRREHPTTCAGHSLARLHVNQCIETD